MSPVKAGLAATIRGVVQLPATSEDGRRVDQTCPRCFEASKSRESAPRREEGRGAKAEWQRWSRQPQDSRSTAVADFPKQTRRSANHHRAEAASSPGDCRRGGREIDRRGRGQCPKSREEEAVKEIPQPPEIAARGAGRRASRLPRSLKLPEVVAPAQDRTRRCSHRSACEQARRPGAGRWSWYRLPRRLRFTPAAPVETGCAPQVPQKPVRPRDPSRRHPQCADAPDDDFSRGPAGQAIPRAGAGAQSDSRGTAGSVARSAGHAPRPRPGQGLRAKDRPGAEERRRWWRPRWWWWTQPANPACRSDAPAFIASTEPAARVVGASRGEVTASRG